LILNTDIYSSIPFPLNTIFVNAPFYAPASPSGNTSSSTARDPDAGTNTDCLPDDGSDLSTDILISILLPLDSCTATSAGPITVTDTDAYALVSNGIIVNNDCTPDIDTQAFSPNDLSLSLTFKTLCTASFNVMDTITQLYGVSNVTILKSGVDSTQYTAQGWWTSVDPASAVMTLNAYNCDNFPWCDTSQHPTDQFFGCSQFGLPLPSC
jgi:hypothetical protein